MKRKVSRYKCSNKNFSVGFAPFFVWKPVFGLDGRRAAAERQRAQFTRRRIHDRPAWQRQPPLFSNALSKQVLFQLRIRLARWKKAFQNAPTFCVDGRFVSGVRRVSNRSKCSWKNWSLTPSASGFFFSSLVLPKLESTYLRVCDRNDNKKFDVSELEFCFDAFQKQCDNYFDATNGEEVFKDADTNSDGIVDKEEFRTKFEQL